MWCAVPTIRSTHSRELPLGVQRLAPEMCWRGYWVHFLRDLKKLVEAHPDNEDVREWVPEPR